MLAISRRANQKVVIFDKLGICIGDIASSTRTVMQIDMPKDTVIVCEEIMDAEQRVEYTNYKKSKGGDDDWC